MRASTLLTDRKFPDILFVLNMLNMILPCARLVVNAAAWEYGTTQDSYPYHVTCSLWPPQVSAALRFAAGKALGDVDDGGEGNNRFAGDYRSSRAGRRPSGDAAEETEGRKLTGESAIKTYRFSIG